MITVLAKSSPPGVPEAVNIGKTYADLKWEPPKHDGGAKITGNKRKLKTVKMIIMMMIIMIKVTINVMMMMKLMMK